MDIVEVVAQTKTANQILTVDLLLWNENDLKGPAMSTCDTKNAGAIVKL